MDFSYRPKQTGRAGAQIVSIPVALGNITANNTTTYAIPVPRGRFYVVGASYQAETVATSPGTILGTLQKRRAATDDTVAISSAFDLEAATASEVSALTVNGGDTNRTVRAGDTLRFSVVSNNSTVTQHAQAFLVVELARLD